MLEENQELELESTDTMEKTTSDDPFDIDIAIQSLDSDDYSEPLRKT